MGVLDLPLSLLGEVFQKYLAVRHTDQLVTHEKTVRVLKSALSKVIVDNYYIDNK